MTLSRRRLVGNSLMLALSASMAPLSLGAAAPDGGATDRLALKVVRPAQALFVAVARAGDRLVAVGEHGLVVLSDDGGRHWRQADVPASVTLTTVRFAGARDGWAAGNQGVVLRTRDGGSTWRKVLDGRQAAAVALRAAQAEAGANVQDAERLVQDGPDKPFLSLATRPDGTLLALGAFGLAFASRDGGASWTSLMGRLPNPDGFSLYGLVERPGEQLLFGEQGLLLSASDASAPFRKAGSPTEATLFGALTLADGSALLMGLRGKVFRSARPDDAWEPIQTPIDASLFAGAQLKDGRVLLVGAAGQLLSSTDSGRSFRNVALARRFPFSGIAVAPDGALVLAGARGLLRVELAELDVAEAPEGVGVAQSAAAAQVSSR